MSSGPGALQREVSGTLLGPAAVPVTFSHDLSRECCPPGSRTSSHLLRAGVGYFGVRESKVKTVGSLEANDDSACDYVTFSGLLPRFLGHGHGPRWGREGR